MTNRTYTQEQKAQVVAEWLAGATQNDLATRHHLPKSTVSTWTKRFPRTALVPKRDLALEFGMSVYTRAMEALEALGAHLRAANEPQFAGVVEGWSTRVADLTRTVVTLGAAIQRGSPEPIIIDETPDVTH